MKEDDDGEGGRSEVSLVKRNGKKPVVDGLGFDCLEDKDDSEMSDIGELVAESEDLEDEEI